VSSSPAQRRSAMDPEDVLGEGTVGAPREGCVG
jgi:hypothetical protein